MSSFDYGKRLPDGQYERHPDQIGPQPIAPYRNAYRHMGMGPDGYPCGAVTYCPENVVKTYATTEGFYNRTFCVRCGDYFPLEQFEWLPDGITVGVIAGEPGEDLRQRGRK